MAKWAPSVQTIQKALMHVVDSQRGVPTLIAVSIGADRSTGEALGPIIGTLGVLSCKTPASTSYTVWQRR